MTRFERTIRSDEWRLTSDADEDDGELYSLIDDPWELWNDYYDESYQDGQIELLPRLFRFHIQTEEPVLPPADIPSGTAAHTA